MKLLLSVLFSSMTCTAQASWLDKSHQVFFPKDVGTRLTEAQGFPVFWWNFLVLKGGERAEAEIICKTLREQAAELKLGRVECLQDLGDFAGTVKDWARDLPLREQKPADEALMRALRAALSKASLPMGSEMIAFLRHDPLESWRQLQELATARMPLNLDRAEGFFHDPSSDRILIPVQMNFPPSELSRTKKLRDALGPHGGVWTGPHWPALANEEQVLNDVSRVSWFGALLLSLLAACLLWLRRFRLLWLLPPVLAAASLSAILTIMVFGNIHGITLSFGTGLIGLSLDYGLHAAFATDIRKTWRANFLGLLTTLSGFMILMNSEVPLLRQLMFFSSLGLVVSFTLLLIQFRLFDGRLRVPPLRIRPGTSRLAPWAAIMFAVAGLAGLATIRPTLDLKQLEFQTPDVRETSGWLVRTSQLRSPVFRIVASGPAALEALNEQRAWSLSEELRQESVANYLPPAASQAANQASWRSDGCEALRAQLTGDEWAFFSPFLDSACGLEIASKAVEGTRSYISHLTNDSKWISLWMPQDERQESLIKKAYPDSVSLKEIVDTFPRTLLEELKWMAPLSALLAFLIIFLHFRNFLLTALALVPFICGLGLVSIVHWIFQLEFSFVSLVGIIMIYGFSLDYGIFVTIGLRDGLNESRKHSSTWSAITFAAVTTASGFLPLLFCGHPVLLHLGQALFFGAIGTYVGAFLGVPYFLQKARAA